MIYIADEDEEESSLQTMDYHLPAPPPPRVVWHIDDGPTTQHLEYHLSDNEGHHDLSGHQSWMQDAHRRHHWEDDYWTEWEEEGEEKEKEEGEEKEYEEEEEEARDWQHHE